MAETGTKLYFKSTTGSTPITPTASASWADTNDKSYANLLNAKDAADTMSTGSTISWTRGTNQRALDRIYVSSPLAGQTLTSWTVRAQLPVKEGSTSDDVTETVINAWIAKPDGSWRANLGVYGAWWYSASAEYLDTGHRNKTAIATGTALDTSIVITAGDHIVLEIGHKVEAGSGTSTATTRWGSGYGGSVATDEPVDNTETGAGYCGWIQFSGTLTFQPRTRLYFSRNIAAPATPAVKAAWSRSADVLYRKLLATKLKSDNVAAGVPVGGTGWAAAGTSCLDRIYVSDPIGAQTISGAVQGMLQVAEVIDSDQVDQVITAIYLTQGDGTYRSTLLDKVASPPADSVCNEFAASTETSRIINGGVAAGSGWAPLTQQTSTAGDRIVIEVGYRCTTVGTTPLASARWGTGKGTYLATDLTLDDTSRTAKDLCGWIELPGTIAANNPAGDGEAEISLPTGAATALHGVAASAAATTTESTAAATSLHSVAGTAPATITALTAEATGTQAATGTATATVPSLTADAVGTTAGSYTAEVAATVDSLTAESVALHGVAVTADATTTAATADANGWFLVFSDAAATVADVTAAAVALHGVAGTAEATTPELTADATGTFDLPVVTGTAEAVATQAVADAVAVHSIAGTVLATVQEVVADATAAHGVAGAAESVTASLTAEAVAYQLAGSADATVPAIVADADGAQIAIGTADSTIAALTASATATHGVAATAAATATAATAAATAIFGTALTTGASPLGGFDALSMLPLATIGLDTASGVAAAVVPTLTASAAGYLNVDGPAVAEIELPLAAADARHGVAGEAAADVAAVTASAFASFPDPPVYGGATAEIVAVTADAAGTQSEAGTAEAVVVAAEAAAEGFVAPCATAEATIDAVVADAVGAQAVAGEAAAEIDPMTGEAWAWIQVDGTGAAEVTLEANATAIYGIEIFGTGAATIGATGEYASAWVG